MKTLFLSFVFFAFTIFSVKAQTFEDINASLPGLSFSVSAFGDADGDGDLDLYLSGMDGSSNISGGLYIYDAGTYTLSGTANISPVYMGSADWGDIDGDNDSDIVILGQDASYADVVEVFQNNGDGTFTDLNAGLASAEQGEVRFADIDGDNDLDITFTGIGAGDRITKFYLNDGSGNFSELTGNTIPGMNNGRIKWADFDNDNDLDFILSGYDDGTGGSNTYYTKLFVNNDNDGTFSESSLSFHQGWLGDVEWGDYNADGNPDLIISGTGGDGTERYTLLYKNNGDGTFTELDPGFDGVSHSSIEWADFDLDGYLDVFIVGETTTPGDGNSISKIYLNNGDDTFTDSGLDVFSYSYYGDADSGDFDGDGKPDIVITGYSTSGYGATNSAVYKNTTVAGVSEINGKIQISPVPAKEFITIKSSDIINKIQILNISGKILYSQNINKSTVNVNTNFLSAGIYFVKIYSNLKQTTDKIIIE